MRKTQTGRIIKPGSRVGKLTIIRPLPLMHNDHSRRFECLCDCGEKTIKSRITLMDRHVKDPRCHSCYVKSQRAYANLMKMFEG